jgi:hypothetical protein
MDRLEKQNKDLQSQLAVQSKDRNVTRNYDLQARCAKDAKSWFNENYRRDKDTTLLDFSNHYNLATNQCFIFVELHLREQDGSSWMNNMTLWNVYENAKYGHYLEEHTIKFQAPSIDKDEIDACDMLDQKCKSIEQFNQFAQSYMNN